ARSLHSHEIRLSSVKISFIDRLLTLIIKNSKDTPNELFVLKYVATFICSINNIPEDIFKRHFENLLQVEILLSLNKEHFDRVLSVLGSDKTPFKEPYLQDIDWKEKMRLLYDLFYSNSELIPFYAPYDSLLFLRYLKKDIYNKTNLQQLLSYLMVNRPHSQSVEEIQALKYLPNEIKHRFRNDSCEYIVTQIVDLFPAGDVSVVYLVRQDAIDLESFAWFNNTERTGALNFVRQKIHNNASADDVQMIDILREYIVTEDDAVFDKFKSLYSSLARHNNDLDWIKNNVQFLKSEQRLINNNLYPNGERLTALEVIEKRLLPHLKQFYKVDVTLDTDSRELFSDSKLKKVYDDVVKIIEDSKLVQGARISESNKKKIMSSIGSLRYHLRSKKNTPELVALDIALSLISEKIMEVVHPEDAILLTEQEFIACLKNYEQLLLLVLSTRYITPENDTVPFDNNFTKALISIKRFFYIQKKGSLNFDLVKESFNCANLGIEQYSASFVNTLRNNLKAILWTNDDNDLEVENKVSLYYKTGPLYHLAELVSSLYSKMLGGKGVIVHKGIGFGRFRFVEAPNDEFNPGDVLVARNPTPDIVHLMMSASAIITENGGSASHAAMIAREHKIPCIVGLLNAQKVLSEHPYVFVDTKNGVVKGVSESEKDDYLSYQRTSFTSISNIKFTDTIDLNYINKCATNSFVLSIDDSSDVSLVGGKGYNLYRLRKMNSSLFSVPPGFCVTTAAFAKFISDNISHMSSINFDLTKSDSSVSEIFSKLNFPHDVLSEIQHSYGSMKYVSVRSSATDEDSAHSTFAGLHDTFLWKKGINNVIHAIKDCYASMYTHRAIIHRSVNKIDIKKALMSVVVQRMVDADFSGVIYTALTEDIEFKGKIFSASRDIIKIEIVFGEGEGIVSGNKTPIVILAHKKTKEYWILADEDVSFLKKFLPTSAGRWFSHKKTILDNIEKLITMSTQIEKVMTNPQDIEFSFLKDRLFVLQTRDIAEELWVELT
ncbi:MAG: PEP/pyruvate-binding domain-containing protein, partial [Candidatus Woesearchaeota archaeon]